MDYYTVFGLHFGSELRCPELHTTTEPASVIIRYSSLKHISIPEPHKSDSHLIGPQQLLINIAGIAQFLVSNGSEILIDADKSTSEKELRLFLLGSAFGAILHQRAFLPIHANAIVINGECIVFAGYSGRGKSTLAAAFAQKGFQLMCDDVCAIKLPAMKPPIGLPGHPHVKLCRDSLTHLNKQAEDHARVRPDTEKYFLPIGTAYYQQALAIKKIYILNYHDEQSIKLQTLNKFNAVIALKNHTYRYRMVNKLNQQKSHHILCAKLAASSTVSRIFRPKNFAMMDALIEQVILDNAV